MYFSTVLPVLALGGQALAAPQLFGVGGGADGSQTITGALSMVQSSIQDLDTSVQSLSGPTDTQGIGAVASKSQNIAMTIMSAQNTVQGAGMSSLFGALGIAQSAMGLSSAVGGLSNDLVAMKPTFDQAGVSSVVLMMLQQQQTGSQSLIQAVTGKLPALAQPFAGGLTGGITGALNSAISVYQQSSTAAQAAAAAPTAAMAQAAAAMATAPAAAAATTEAAAASSDAADASATDSASLASATADASATDSASLASATASATVPLGTAAGASSADAAATSTAAAGSWNSTSSGETLMRRVHFAL